MTRNDNKRGWQMPPKIYETNIIMWFRVIVNIHLWNTISICFELRLWNFFLKSPRVTNPSRSESRTLKAACTFTENPLRKQLQHISLFITLSLFTTYKIWKVVSNMQSEPYTITYCLVRNCNYSMQPCT